MKNKLVVPEADNIIVGYAGDELADCIFEVRERYGQVDSLDMPKADYQYANLLPRRVIYLYPSNRSITYSENIEPFFITLGREASMK